MQYDKLYNHPVYKKAGKIIFFGNQASYDHQEKKYLFDKIIEQKKLLRILQPEHGLFSNAQDQDIVEDLLYKNIPCISLYNKITDITGPQKHMFSDADTLLIDIQDAGVRYFTYTTHLFNLLEFAARYLQQISVIVTDRTNPAGKKAEGTLLPEKYQSFLGYAGMIHRHGLSTGELCKWFVQSRNLKLNLHIVQIPGSFSNKNYIAPSPNLPTIESLWVYPGQCFWEATSFSEGRGTTRPFVLFGHPDIPSIVSEQIAMAFNKKFEGMAYLRSTKFEPVFHKHKSKLCTGWQIHLQNHQKYPDIFGSLWLMREVKNVVNFNFWREGPYEFDSDFNAAQILIGDDDLIEFVEGHIPEKIITDKLKFHASQWKKEIQNLE